MLWFTSATKPALPTFHSSKDCNKQAGTGGCSTLFQHLRDPTWNQRSKLTTANKMNISSTINHVSRRIKPSSSIPGNPCSCGTALQFLLNKNALFLWVCHFSSVQCHKWGVRSAHRKEEACRVCQQDILGFPDSISWILNRRRNDCYNQPEVALMQPQSSPEMHLERFPDPQESRASALLFCWARWGHPAQGRVTVSDKPGNNQRTSTTSLNSEHCNLYASPIKWAHVCFINLGVILKNFII